MAASAQTASESVTIKADAFNYDLIVETPDAVQDLPSGIPDDHMCQRVAQGCLDELGLEGTGIPDECEEDFATADGHVYKLMPYDANNAIVIQSNADGASAIIDFESPVDAGKYNTIGLIAVSHLGDYYPQADITLHYVDGTTEVVTKEIVDWCQNPGGSYPAPLASFTHRVRPTNSNADQAHVEGTANFFHEITLPISKDVVGLTVKNNVVASHEWGWPVIVVMAATAFQDESASIQHVEDAATTADGAIYNVAGQRVSTTQQGLYIQSGRKFVRR